MSDTAAGTTAWSAGLSAAGHAAPAALLASLAGLILAAGFDHLLYGLGLLAGVVLAGLLVAPRIAREGDRTVTGAVRRRFGRVAGVLAGIVVVLVAVPLVTAELAVVGLFAESAFGLSHAIAVPAAAALVFAAGIGLGETAFRRASAAAYVLFAAGLLAALFALAFEAQGTRAPHVAFGEALTAVAALEDTLLENGLVDFDTFSPHVSAFLRLRPLDMLALLMALALGTAAMPSLLQSLAAGGARPMRVRLAGAWTALFVMIVLVSVPVVAAYAKLVIYRAMAAGTPLSALPAWLDAPLAAGLAHVHGTSLHLLNAVTEAVRAGNGDAAAVLDALALQTASATRWAALDAGTQDAMLAAARSLLAAPETATAWEAYRAEVLPAAAVAAGNDALALTQAALVVEPFGLLLALPGLAGAPPWAAPLLWASVAAAGLAVATAAARSLLSLARADGTAADGHAHGWSSLVLLLAALSLATIVAGMRPDEIVVFAVGALSLAAAGLFPVLAVGLAWRRATAAGAVAAMAVGTAVTMYYDIGTEVFPAAFYETWPQLSNAGDYAVEEFAARAEALRAAEGTEAAAAAAAALDDWARGTPTRPGLANWFGIDGAAGAIFGVPAGLVALLVASLVTAPFGSRRPMPGRDPQP